MAHRTISAIGGVTVICVEAGDDSWFVFPGLVGIVLVVLLECSTLGINNETRRTL